VRRRSVSQIAIIATSRHSSDGSRRLHSLPPKIRTQNQPATKGRGGNALISSRSAPSIWVSDESLTMTAVKHSSVQNFSVDRRKK
jgi:hypothetical protein